MPRPSAPRSLPAFIQPMLACRGTAFDDDAYLFEIKWNGIRMLAFLETPCYRLMIATALTPLPVIRSWLSWPDCPREPLA